MRLRIACLTLAMIGFAWLRAPAQEAAAPSLLPPPGSASAAPALRFDDPLPFPDPPADAELRLDLEPSVVRVEQGPDGHQVDNWFGPEPWDTSIEFGLNGSSGTSESLSIRAGGQVKRESRFSKLKLAGTYNGATKSGNATQNNAQFDARNDWLLDETSPWTLYGTGEVFYDEFQSFDLQTSANTGIGYRFIYEPELDLIGRCGVGASREFGGPEARWVPESLFGLEYNQKVSAGQKFYSKLDYYPEWEEVGEFRLVADMGWQIQFAQPSNLSLKFSVSDRYDSTPNGVSPHLVNYSVLLLLKL